MRASSSSSVSICACLSAISAPAVASAWRSACSATSAPADHLTKSGLGIMAASQASASCSSAAFNSSATFSAAAFTAGTILRTLALMSLTSIDSGPRPSKPVVRVAP
ncbi:hypothetical protein D9M69_622340 [compost metagenome]